MKLPILLNGHTMAIREVLRPDTLGIDMKLEPFSAVTMSFARDPRITVPEVGDWVLVNYPHGGSGVFYVKDREPDRTGGRTAVTLEHTAALLNDTVVFGDQTPAMMGGTADAVAAETVIDYMLGFQTFWTLGACDFDDAQGWNFSNGTIWENLCGVADAIEDCFWEFDQTVFPWEISLKQYPASVGAEMRLSRNISTLKTKTTRSGMYTRVYPTGHNGLTLPEQYLDENTGTYGVISRVITDSSIKNAALLRAWAAKELHKNAAPVYSATITGLELSERTGETLDKLTPGKLCRVPVAGDGVISERIMQLKWQDALADPEAVTVSLANTRKTVQSVINKAASGGGAGGRKGKQDTDKTLGELDVKVTEILGSVLWAQKDDITAAVGQLVVTEYPDQHKELKVISGTSLVIERDGANLSVIDAGNVLTAINASTEGVTINASKINLNGYVTAAQLAAETARFNNLVSGTTQAAKISAVNVTGLGVYASNLYVADYHYISATRTFMLADGTTEQMTILRRTT